MAERWPGEAIWSYSDEAVMEAQTVADADGSSASYMEVYLPHLDVPDALGIEIDDGNLNARVVLDATARREMAAVLLRGLPELEQA